LETRVLAVHVRHPPTLALGPHRAGAWTFSLLFFLESVARASLVTVLPLTAFALFGSKEAVSLAYTLVSVVSLAFTFAIPALVRLLSRRWAYTAGAGLLGLYAALLALSVYASYILMQRPNPLDMPLGWTIACIAIFVVMGVLTPLAFDAAALVPFFVLALIVVAFAVLCVIAEKVLESFVWIAVPFLAVGIPILGIFIKAEFGWDSTAVFAFLVVFVIIQLVMILSRANWIDARRLAWELPLIVVLLGLGLLFRLGDGYKGVYVGENLVDATRKFLCEPDGAFQAHAHWHLLGGIALLMAYDLLTQFQKGDHDPLDRPVIFPDAQAYKT